MLTLEERIRLEGGFERRLRHARGIRSSGCLARGAGAEQVEATSHSQSRRHSRVPREHLFRHGEAALDIFVRLAIALEEPSGPPLVDFCRHAPARCIERLGVATGADLLETGLEMARRGFAILHRPADADKIELGAHNDRLVDEPWIGAPGTRNPWKGVPGLAQPGLGVFALRYRMPRSQTISDRTQVREGRTRVDLIRSFYGLKDAINRRARIEARLELITRLLKVDPAHIFVEVVVRGALRFARLTRCDGLQSDRVRPLTPRDEDLHPREEGDARDPPVEFKARRRESDHA
ncbi:MAG TPA: hypothetical protein VK459_19450, partial [Polyangiaceae bacterium]|nr:hypothetical protein [Polyangiaceae bacterium]